MQLAFKNILEVTSFVGLVHVYYDHSNQAKEIASESHFRRRNTVIVRLKQKAIRSFSPYYGFLTGSTSLSARLSSIPTLVTVLHLILMPHFNLFLDFLVDSCPRLTIVF